MHPPNQPPPAHDRLHETPARAEWLFVCPHCFAYTTDAAEMAAHDRFCEFDVAAVGELVFRGRGGEEVWCVDGKEEGLWCQRLSACASGFIESKSVAYDVEGFWFYVLYIPDPDSNANANLPSNTTAAAASSSLPSDTKPAKSKSKPPRTCTNAGRKIAGYFSKEKKSWDDLNLACILIFPHMQSLGLGRLLVELSYELTLRAHDPSRPWGGPERPLSAAAQRLYAGYWRDEVGRCLLLWEGGQASVREIGRRTGIHPEDVVGVLKGVEGVEREGEVVRVRKEAVRRWVGRGGGRVRKGEIFVEDGRVG